MARGHGSATSAPTRLNYRSAPSRRHCLIGRAMRCVQLAQGLAEWRIRLAEQSSGHLRPRIPPRGRIASRRNAWRAGIPPRFYTQPFP